MPMRISVLLLLLLPLGCDEPRSEANDDIPVQVGMVALDQRNLPVVILEEQDGSRMLPIWIGTAEADSIAAQMDGRKPPRPNSHDFAKRVIEGLNGEVIRVVVSDLRKGTYYAILFLQVREKVIEIDARPSDAIALAIRVDAPIFVRSAVFDAAQGDTGVLEPKQSVTWPTPTPVRPVGNRPATPRLNL